MLNRRLVVRSGLAALGAISACGPITALGQSRTAVKIRYNEVVRSVLYGPAYVAITKGYFKDVGIDVELADEHTSAQLESLHDTGIQLSNQPDAALAALQPSRLHARSRPQLLRRGARRSAAGTRSAGDGLPSAPRGAGADHRSAAVDAADLLLTVDDAPHGLAA